MNKNFDKKVTTAAVIGTSLLREMANAAFAATITSNQLQKNSNVGTAKGTLEGQMVSYLTIKMPAQFKYVDV